MKKVKECKKCGNRMDTSYVRLNIKGKRIWIAIGFFCMDCLIHKITIKKPIKK